MANKISQFCASLRKNESEANLFSQFLRELRDKKSWRSQQAIREDPLVESVLGRHRAKHFPRVLDRAIKTMRTSRETLGDFAKIFGYTSTETFIDALKEGEGRLSQIITLPGALPKLIPDESGHFIFPRHTVIVGRSGDRYIIQEYRKGIVSRGLSFKAKAEGSREVLFIKMLALRDGMKEAEREFRIQRFTDFVEREANNLYRLKDVRGIAHVKDYGFVDLPVPDSRRVQKVPFIATKFLNGENLREVIARKYGATGITDGPVWISLATQLLKIIRSVHSHGVRHGDLRPENIMICANDVFIVDFAEGGMIVDTNAEKGSGPSLDNCPDPYLAPELHTHRKLPLEESQDIYSLGGVLFWLASGKEPPKNGISVDYELRTYIYKHINKQLKDYNEGILHIITDCLHYRPADRTSHADDALRTLEMFETMKERITDISIGAVKQELSSLTAAVRSLPLDPLFGNMIRRDLAHMARRVTDMMTAGRAEVNGTRNEIIQSLLGFLSILEPGDEYFTTSSLDYWLPENLGVDGRFLCANKMLGLQGVRIRRVLIVTDEEISSITRGFSNMTNKNPEDTLQAWKDRWFAEIILAQSKVKRIVNNGEKLIAGAWRDCNYYVGYDSVSPEKKVEILQHGYHIGIIRKKGGDQAVSLSFQEMGDSRFGYKTIRKIYVWNVEGKARSLLKQRQTQLEESLDRSKLIVDLLPQEKYRSLFSSPISSAISE